MQIKELFTMSVAKVFVLLRTYYLKHIYASRDVAILNKNVKKKSVEICPSSTFVIFLLPVFLI